MTPEFLLTSLIVVASPGTGAIYTLSAGLSQGRRAALLAAFACTLGIVPHMLAAITGLAALLHSSAVAFDMVKYLGVAYLLYMAWQSLRAEGALALRADAAAAPPHRVIAQGILINLLNPKLSIFFLAFLPQFLRPGTASPLSQMIHLSLAFMAMTFVIFALYGLFAAQVRQHITTRPAVLLWLRRSFAAAFVALGARLALQRI